MPTQRFTIRPTPGQKGCFDILLNGNDVIAQGFGRADMNRELRKYRMGWKRVEIVNEPAAAVAVR